MSHKAAASSRPGHHEFSQRDYERAVEGEEISPNRKGDHQQQVDPRTGGGGERQADLRQRADQRQFQRLR